MPPKTQFSKQQILDSALKISIKDGISSLTVRKLAGELGCSVAPIYVNFSNSEALMEAVMDSIRRISWEYSTRSYTEFGFFNIGIGQILFVKDYPRLFLDLFNLDPQCLKMSSDQEQQMIEVMKKDKMLKGLNRQQLTDLLQKMSIFTLGLSTTMIKNQQNLPIDKALTLMEETAHQLVHSYMNNFQDCYTPYPKINLP
jgi:hypothetical protein